MSNPCCSAFDSLSDFWEIPKDYNQFAEFFEVSCGGQSGFGIRSRYSRGLLSDFKRVSPGGRALAP